MDQRAYAGEAQRLDRATGGLLNASPLIAMEREPHLTQLSRLNQFLSDCLELSEQIQAKFTGAQPAENRKPLEPGGMSIAAETMQMQARVQLLRDWLQTFNQDLA